MVIYNHGNPVFIQIPVRIAAQVLFFDVYYVDVTTTIL